MNIELEIKTLRGREFEGHGAVFGNVDLVGDVMAPGSFRRSLAEHKAAGTMPLMLWMHQPAQVAGAWSEMREDRDGLYVRGTLAPTTLGDEMHALLKMEAVRGLSIGYRTRDSDWQDDGTRVIKDVDLVEVSLVSMAANPLAEVTAVKSRLSARGEFVPDRRSFERDLRDRMNLSRSIARKVADALFSGSAGGRDDDDAEQIARDILRSLA